MTRSRVLCASLLSACCANLAIAQSRPIATTAARPASGFGSAGFEGDGYVYVAGQGARRADGSMPGKFSEQVRQSLDNVRSVVEASGLTMNHVVYVQVYVEDVARYAELDETFAAYFPQTPPARAVLGVARNPDSPVQINAVAVRDLEGRRSVWASGVPSSKAFSPGVLTRDRLFISTMPGLDPASGRVPSKPGEQVDLALDRLSAVLQAAGLTAANMVFVNPYLTSDIPMRIMNEHYARRFEFGNTPARATIEVSALPEGAHIAYTGVAVRDLSRRRAVRPKNMAPSPTASPCVFAGDTLYCSAKSGFIPGPNGGVYMAETANQTRQTMRNLLDNLEEAEMGFDQTVSTTIYLDSLGESRLFHGVYQNYFKGALPAETTLQQLAPGERKANAEGQYPDLEQVSLIAVRTHWAADGGRSARPSSLLDWLSEFPLTRAFLTCPVQKARFGRTGFLAASTGRSSREAAPPGESDLRTSLSRARQEGLDS